MVASMSAVVVAMHRVGCKGMKKNIEFVEGEKGKQRILKKEEKEKCR